MIQSDRKRVFWQPKIAFLIMSTLTLAGCHDRPSPISYRDYDTCVYHTLEEYPIIRGLLEFYSDVGRFPSTTQGLRALFEVSATGTKETEWDGPYAEGYQVSTVLKDPLRQPIGYGSAADGQSVLLHYYGRDRQKGTSDDLFVALGRLTDEEDTSARVRAAVDAVRVRLGKGLARYREDAQSYPYHVQDLVEEPVKLARDAYVPHPWKGPYVSRAEFDLASQALGEYEQFPFFDKWRDRGFTLLLRIESPHREATIYKSRREGDVQLGFIRREESFDVFIARRYIGEDPTLTDGSLPSGKQR